jgi:hypothetical protein
VGIVHDWQPEPRVGIAYNIKQTNSVLRVSYSRVLETPFNENLILASLGASNPVIVDVIGGFLSTFSGSHFVTPRAETAELGFHF